MHFEFLVEDRSGKKFLDGFLPRLLGHDDTFNVHSYKGIGAIPRNLNADADPRKRILLDRLPKLLRGYGNTHANYPDGYRAVVIVVCDLDVRCHSTFREELFAVLEACSPKPEAHFCFAIEEGEAWLLGDIPAVRAAYPDAKDSVLNAYVNDAICGTWEKLADAIYPGGAQALSTKGWCAVGAEKSQWAEKITPYMDVDNNNSPSFEYFRDKIRGLLQCAEAPA